MLPRIQVMTCLSRPSLKRPAVEVYGRVLLFFQLSSLSTYYFFFSSRRRHTRSDRDWSSDVCSSDLVQPRRVGAAHDQRDMREMRVTFQPEQLEHRVERAALAFVADLDALHVERDQIGRASCRERV